MDPAYLISADWLTDSERAPKSLGAGDTLADAVALFQADTDLRLLPIIDTDRQPVGAIFERDVRRLLLNPYGHALLRNPSFNCDLAAHTRDCPTAELCNDIGVLVDHYRRCDGREGMILIRDGQLFATLTNRRLLMLAAENEHRQSAARLVRAERIASAGELFETHAAALSTQMVQLSNAVQRLAEATAHRATIAGNRASAVAGAAIQTRQSMGLVAERGKGLAEAFRRIEDYLSASRQTSGETVERVCAGSERARRLLGSAQSIDSVMALVNDIAGTVNLLSLNAAIEAARAGEAGRGFAVVASEIRGLSDQTHEATCRISGEIEALRSEIAVVAADYAEIETGIGIMTDKSAEVDRAIVREADTSRLIAQSVDEASRASVEIEEAVTTIVKSVRTASSSARELDGLATQLREGSSALQSHVAQFLAEVRAA